MGWEKPNTTKYNSTPSLKVKLNVNKSPLMSRNTGNLRESTTASTHFQLRSPKFSLITNVTSPTPKSSKSLRTSPTPSAVTGTWIPSERKPHTRCSRRPSKEESTTVNSSTSSSTDGAMPELLSASIAQPPADKLTKETCLSCLSTSRTSRVGSSGRKM